MNDTNKHIDFLRTNIPITLNIFNDKDLKPTQLFAIGLLERLYYSSFSFGLQIDDYKKFKQLDFSIGLTLRALLLDALISFNLYKTIYDLENSEQSILDIENVADEYCNRVLADGLRQTVKYFQTAKDCNLIDDTKLKDNFNDIALYYQFYLHNHNSDGSPPKVSFDKPMPNPELFKNLANDNDLSFLSRLYDAYNFYSKYDHFGILYFRVIRQDLKSCLKQFENCIAILLKHLLNLLFILDQFSDGDKNVRQQLVIATEYQIKNNS
jgi:hypothetical protein